MFAFFRNWRNRNASIKNFSTTMTTAQEGTRSQKELSPDIAEILKTVKKSSNISNETLNKLAGYYFNQKTIAPGVYNIRNAVAVNMCFEINSVNPVYDGKGDVANIYLELREITFNIELSMTVSVKDFHEIFNHLTFPPIELKS